MQLVFMDNLEKISQWLSNSNLTQVVIEIDCAPYLVSTKGIFTAGVVDCVTNRIDYNPPHWLIQYIRNLDSSCG
jgi:hypothetical protein